MVDESRNGQGIESMTTITGSVSGKSARVRRKALGNSTHTSMETGWHRCDHMVFTVSRLSFSDLLYTIFYWKGAERRGPSLQCRGRTYRLEYTSRPRPDTLRLQQCVLWRCAIQLSLSVHLLPACIVLTILVEYHTHSSHVPLRCHRGLARSSFVTLSPARVQDCCSHPGHLGATADVRSGTQTALLPAVTPQDPTQRSEFRCCGSFLSGTPKSLRSRRRDRSCNETEKGLSYPILLPTNRCLPCRTGWNCGAMAHAATMAPRGL